MNLTDCYSVGGSWTEDVIHYKQHLQTFLFTDNHDVLFDKE